MKKLKCFIILLAIYSIGYTQSSPIEFNCNSPKKIPQRNLSPEDTIKIYFTGNKENIEKYFHNTNYKSAGVSSPLFNVLKKIDPTLTTKENFLSTAVQKNKDTVKILITKSMIAPAPDSNWLYFSKDGRNYDTTLIISKEIEEAEKDVDNSNSDALIIINPGMTASVNGSSNCQLCDLYAKKQLIKSKKDRIYSTDYIIIYDPSLRKDAYTICKRVFGKSDSSKSGSNPYFKLYERYIKIGAKWFAPHVGSQIRFEVINQPLSKQLKLTVDEQDVFNDGASQFSSLISGLVSSNIINPVSGSSTTDTPALERQKSQDDKKIAQKLAELKPQILRYVIGFRISSCSIQEHYANLAIIIQRLSSEFQLSAVNADQFLIQLTKKINEETATDEEKASNLKEAQAITEILNALETVQPIAYTTLRAKNKDYIEIKYTDANNVISKPENIRMSGGMKIDFSAGFVLTGLRDYTYSLKDATVKYTPLDNSNERDTTGNIIIKEDDGNNQVGVGILTHFYPRISSHYNIGGTVGLMTSTNLNLRLMLGGSVMISSFFGSNNRVSFSGGIVWGKVKRLSVQHEDFFNEPRLLNKQPQFYSQAAAPTPIDRNEHSWFFAITLNFGGK